MVGNLWWDGFGFGPSDLTLLIFGHGQGSVDADPLWTYVHSSRSNAAFDLSAGGQSG